MGTASNSVLSRFQSGHLDLQRHGRASVKDEAWASFSGAIAMEGALRPQRHLGLERHGCAHLRCSLGPHRRKPGRLSLVDYNGGCRLQRHLDLRKKKKSL